MSIAELIMTGTNRASESTAWVGDSLAKLGQNVGAALAQKEQQKQAQAMLPYLQQSMQESMTLAGQGQTGEAYAKLMPFITNPSVINNPNLLLPIETALKLNQVAADDYMRSEQLRIQEGMYNQRSDYNSERIRLLEEKQSGGGGGGGSNFSQRFNQARGRGGPTIVEVSLPGEPNFNQPTDMPATQSGVPAMQGGANQGFSFGAGAYQPSEQTLQQFAENSDQYDAAKPKQKKAIEAQRTIVYDNQDALGKDISNLDNDQFGFTQVVAGAADPTFFGVKFARFKQGDVNAKGEQTYKANDDASASIGKLQEAFNLVNDRPELKDIYTKAGGWKNIELKPTAAKKASVDELDNTPAMFEVINKKNPNEKVGVTQEEFALLGSINKMIPTSQTNDMEIIRVGEEKETATEAPAELSREEAIKKATEIKNRGTKTTTGATELSLEEEIASLEQKKKPATAAPAGRGAKMTPELKAKLAQAEQQKVTANTKSGLVSELTRLEKLIYDIPRAAQKTLKYEESEPAVQKILKKISEINNQLASL
jgi:hypothetical protein